MIQSRLFRSEALAHQADRGLGEVILANQPGALMFSGLAVLMAVLIIAFGCYGEFARKAHVQGYLTPDKGLLKVYAPVGGTVVERPVGEGDQVRRGDVLAVISTERGSLQTLETQGAAIALLTQRRDSLQQETQAQHEIDSLRQQRLRGRIASLQTQLEKLDASRATQQARLRAAEESAARFAELKSKQFVAAAQVEQMRDAALAQRGQLQELERDRVALQGELEMLHTELAEAALEAQTRQSALTRAVNELDQQLTEHESSRNIVITAPASGVVTAILIEPGQHGDPRAPLLSIIPNGAALEAQLLVPSRAIGFIEVGHSVALRYQAFPYQRFGHHHGEINSIAKTLIAPGDASLPVPLQEPVYLVSVKLDQQTVQAYGRELSLQSGMLLDGDIFLDRRTVLQWVLDPLYSLTKSV